MDFNGRVVVITGGGNGIGRQIVLEALRRGARVAAVDIRKEALDDTAALGAAGDRLSIHTVDITDRTATALLPEDVIAAHGAVDVLINNAGIIQPFVRFNDLDLADIDRVINVNLHGPINMVKAFLPHLLRRPAAHIANVSSMGAFLPVPGQTMYGATKAAVKLLTEGLYAELLDTNVGVSVIMPGAVGTDIATNSGIQVSAGQSEEAPSFPTTSPEDASRIILDGVERNESHIFVGKDAKFMNAACRAAPRRATHMITKRMKSLLPA